MHARTCTNVISNHIHASWRHDDVCNKYTHAMLNMHMKWFRISIDRIPSRLSKRQAVFRLKVLWLFSTHYAQHRPYSPCLLFCVHMWKRLSKHVYLNRRNEATVSRRCLTGSTIGLSAQPTNGSASVYVVHSILAHITDPQMFPSADKRLFDWTAPPKSSLSNWTERAASCCCSSNNSSNSSKQQQQQL